MPSNVKTMTSMERKTRTVNQKDIASQFANALGKEDPVKKLKSKNSELLAKYREKLRDSETEEDNQTHSTVNESENDGNSKAVPKLKEENFRGVSFDNKEDNPSQSSEIKKGNPDKPKKNWRNGKNYHTKGKSDNNSSGKKFKPFKRRTKTDGNKSNQPQRF